MQGIDRPFFALGALRRVRNSKKDFFQKDREKDTLVEKPAELWTTWKCLPD
jgi:hypothetical protein